MLTGEIRKLPRGISPMWTELYAVQETAARHYIVSAKKVGGYNGLESGIEWSCSCRKEGCKHAAAVQVKLGVAISIPLEKQFELPLAKKSPAVINSQQSSFEDKGRKFRTS